MKKTNRIEENEGIKNGWREEREAVNYISWEGRAHEEWGLWKETEENNKRISYRPPLILAGIHLTRRKRGKVRKERGE